MAEVAAGGEEDYRGFVGPREQYDVMGATQFALLYALGLRERHRLLDIGCGSLRAGRLLVPYLAPGNYVGIEPHSWLVEEAIAHELGSEIIELKSVTFSDREDFEVAGLGEFDFVLAQSIASHTGPVLARRLLSAVMEALAPDSGLAALTFVHADVGDPRFLHVRTAGDDVPRWLYPGCFSYQRSTVEELVREAGLFGGPIPWFHPRQTWWLVARAGSSLPPESFLEQLRGPTLSEGFEDSTAGADAPPMVNGAEERLVDLVAAALPRSVTKVERLVAPALRAALIRRRGHRRGDA